MSFNPKGNCNLSNGPGDPQKCPANTIETTKKLIENNVPTLGICLGCTNNRNCGKHRNLQTKIWTPWTEQTLC